MRLVSRGTEPRPRSWVFDCDVNFYSTCRGREHVAPSGVKRERVGLAWSGVVSRAPQLRTPRVGVVSAVARVRFEIPMQQVSGSVAGGVHSARLHMVTTQRSEARSPHTRVFARVE